jgi:hypothetical protein
VHSLAIGNVRIFLWNEKKEKREKKRRKNEKARRKNGQQQ